MSGFLLDTNVISELIKPKPERLVTAWIEATVTNYLLLSEMSRRSLALAVHVRATLVYERPA